VERAVCRAARVSERSKSGVFTQTRKGGEQAYLITWRCYGNRFPGQDGAVPRTQNRFGSPLPEPSAPKERHSRNRMPEASYVLDEVRRQVVLDSVCEVCRFRGWTLLAAHIRTNHVHIVATAESKPEPVMVAMKAYSSRALNRRGVDLPGQRRWARHGSTQYLWNKESVRAAIRYVVEEQGLAMAVYEGPPLADAQGSARVPIFTSADPREPRP
jgi:REP element-mobilizing transposase RayT